LRERRVVEPAITIPHSETVGGVMSDLVDPPLDRSPHSLLEILQEIKFSTTGTTILSANFGEHERFFENSNAYAAQLRSLLTENFQIIGV
jgi:hypothetical protein